MKIRVAFRSVRPERDALIPHPNPDDRWIGAGSESAICAADSVTAVHAEIAKHLEMAGIDNWIGMPRKILTADLEVDGFLDLIDAVTQQKLAISNDLLTVDFNDQRPKEVAYEHPRRCYLYAVKNDHDGVISCSAAYSGAHVFVVRRDAIERGVISRVKEEIIPIPEALYKDSNRRRGIPLSAL